MFLCALGRPRRDRQNIGYTGSAVGEYDDRADVDISNNDQLENKCERAGGNWYWDGKVGCYPIVEYRAAQRSSQNRPRGTVEPHPLSIMQKSTRN
jgi:hypothetical protein